MNEVKELQSKVLDELKRGPSNVDDLALTLDATSRDVRKVVRGLREDGILICKSGVYHYSYSPTTQANYRLIETQKQQQAVNSLIDAEFKLLEERLKKPEVKDLELKTQVLEKLEPMLSGDIGKVLLAIRDDLKGVAGV